MNIVFIVVVLITLCTALNGFKKGMIEEIISLVTLVAGLSLLAIIVSVISNYLKKEISNAVIGVILFIAIVILFQIAQLISKGLRIIFKLPVIRGVNKIAGLAFGIMEGIVLVWIAFLLLQCFELGDIKIQILRDVQCNQVLIYLYQNNYLSNWFHLNVDVNDVIHNLENII